MYFPIVEISVSLLLLSNGILENEFGIYGDQMPDGAAAAQQQRSIERQYQHRPEGLKPRTTQKNSSVSRPIGSNSQFQPRGLPRGSTLRPGYGSAPPTAPSRFSRPSYRSGIR